MNVFELSVFHVLGISLDNGRWLIPSKRRVSIFIYTNDKRPNKLYTYMNLINLHWNQNMIRYQIWEKLYQIATYNMFTNL